MYDCHFGDCFNIDKGEGVSLLVDYGIHTGSKLNFSMHPTTMYYNILQDFDDNQDFLLTHYHADHYGGATWMAQNTNFQFRNVYIPDIWSEAEYVPAICLTLLKGEITKSYIEKRMTLIDFLKAICDIEGKIYFVERGTEIQNYYKALWPSNDFIKKESAKLWEKIRANLEKNREGVVTELQQVSEDLRNEVVLMQSGDFDREAVRNQLISLYSRMENIFNIVPEIEESLKFRLDELGNEISIVFQNSIKSDNNILFTGDFGKSKKNWKYIENNEDGLVEMHEIYKTIKIAHHGTAKYYHSYANRVGRGSNYLIPCGKNAHNWKIDSKYSSEANAKEVNVFCSECSMCNAKNVGRCTCASYREICPNLYLDI